MYCFKCGTKLINGSLFCYNCGQDLAAILQLQNTVSSDEPSDTSYIKVTSSSAYFDNPVPSAVSISEEPVSNPAAIYDQAPSYISEPDSVPDPEPVSEDNIQSDDIWEDIPEIVYLTLSRYNSDFLDGADVNISIDDIGYGKIDAGRGKRYQISSGIHKIDFELGGDVTTVELDLKKDTDYDFIVNSFGSVEEFTDDD